jgi:hypothetical protein
LPIIREQERVDLLQKLGRPLFPVGTPFSKAVFGSIVPERGKDMRGECHTLNAWKWQTNLHDNIAGKHESGPIHVVGDLNLAA